MVREDDDGEPRRGYGFSENPVLQAAFEELEKRVLARWRPKLEAAAAVRACGGTEAVSVVGHGRARKWSRDGGASARGRGGGEMGDGRVGGWVGGGGDLDAKRSAALSQVDDLPTGGVEKRLAGCDGEVEGGGGRGGGMEEGPSLMDEEGGGWGREEEGREDSEEDAEFAGGGLRGFGGGGGPGWVPPDDDYGGFHDMGGGGDGGGRGQRQSEWVNETVETFLREEQEMLAREPEIRRAYGSFFYFYF